ncbi:MAG: hypothetical protein ACI4U2_05710 [Christensenellaceae bacterium]
MKLLHVTPLFAAVLALSTAFSCGALPVQAEETNAEPASYLSVSVPTQDAVSGKEISFDCWYSDAFFEENGENRELLKLSMALSAETYMGTDPIRETVTEMGYTVVGQYNYDRKATSSDCDFVAYTVAAKDYGEGTIYGVFLQGTPSNAQWYSNFNVGLADVHRGFDTAMQEVFATLSQIILAEDAATNKVWVTGHSRGGAVGNLLGDQLNRSSFVMEENVCAYNFAVPATTKNPVAYENIYNYNLAGDIVTALPLEQWGFSRHGVTSVFDAKLDRAAQTLFGVQTGVEYQGKSDAEDYVAALGEWCPTQESYYEEDLGYKPVDLVTTYLVPFLTGEKTPTISEIFTNPSLLAYMLAHEPIVRVLGAFLDQPDAVVHTHSTTIYMDYATLGYPHEHLLDEYVSDGNATCIEDGTKTATCYCGKSDTVQDEGSALGHDFSHYVSDGNATCTEDGTMTAICSRCGASDTVTEEHTALGHTYKMHSVASDGSIYYRCIRCDDEIKHVDIGYAAIKGVSDQEYLGEPVLLQIQLSYRGVNLIEGQDYTVVYSDNDKIGTATALVTGIGMYEGTLSLSFEIRQHEHTFDRFVSDGNATCLEDGTETATCYCGMTETRTEEGSALGHDFVLRETTETEERYSCTRCGETKSVRLMSAATLTFDPILFEKNRDESCIVVAFGEEGVPFDCFNIDSWSVEEVPEEGYYIAYTVTGINGYTGTKSANIFLPYPPDPNAWIPVAVTFAAAGVALLGVGAAVAVGVVLKKKEQ